MNDMTEKPHPTKQCPACAQLNPDFALYCRYCGRSFHPECPLYERLAVENLVICDKQKRVRMLLSAGEGDVQPFILVLDENGQRRAELSVLDGVNLKLYDEHQTVRTWIGSSSFFCLGLKLFGKDGKPRIQLVDDGHGTDKLEFFDEEGKPKGGISSTGGGMYLSVNGKEGCSASLNAGYDSASLRLKG